MKLLNDWKMSQWAYFECLNGNDIPEIRNLIKDDYYIFNCCLNVKDRKEMWYKITDSEWAYWYCKYIKDRKEVRKYCTKNWGIKGA